MARGEAEAMRSCNRSCRLCDRIVISSAVTFTGGNLVINLPAGNYGDCCRYCIVVAQAIPATSTINAPVFITIGTGTTLYPLNKCNCAQATACSIRTRTRYPVRVITTANGGSFRLLCEIPCAPNNALASLPGATEADTSGDTE